LVVTSEALPEQTFVGRVTAIAPAADEKNRLFDTEVTIPNAGGTLKPGMIASIVIDGATSSQKLPAVPLSAIVRSKDSSESYAVFVIEMNADRATARLRNVKLGDAFGNMIVVNEGLKVGEGVISVGSTLIHDGSAIQIVP
jgi:multidrug efflux system membrane fusion protein